MLVSAILDVSAAALNDAAQEVYTDAIQLPYFNMALRELREHFELNNIPVTNKKSSPINVAAGVTVISFTSTPALPADLVEIRQLWSSGENANNYTPMTKVDFIPNSLTGQTVGPFTFWAWQNQAITLPASNQDQDIILDYIYNLFAPITNVATDITLINAETFLSYRTAALCAEFIGENGTRAASLNVNAIMGIDRALGIGTKGRQTQVVRRKPFRSGYKARG